MGRRIFVGDIQGCLAELQTLLDELGFEPGHDSLHPVGDLVNRGPDSAGCLRLLRSLGAEGVLGNHDLHLLRRAAGKRPPGRLDTLDELLSAPDLRELLDWLAEQPLVRAWSDILLVHAGLHPSWKDPVGLLSGRDLLIADPEVDFATRVRWCTPEGERPEDDDSIPPAPHAPWWHFQDHGETVVFGHWAARGLVLEPGLRGLDSGCVWGGRLTAWIAEEDRLVSVPALRAYQTPDGQAATRPSE